MLIVSGPLRASGTQGSRLGFYFGNLYILRRLIRLCTTEGVLWWRAWRAMCRQRHHVLPVGGCQRQHKPGSKHPGGPGAGRYLPAAGRGHLCNELHDPRCSHAGCAKSTTSHDAGFSALGTCKHCDTIFLHCCLPNLQTAEGILRDNSPAVCKCPHMSGSNAPVWQSYMMHLGSLTQCPHNPLQVT